jgi:hypothetical protein
MLKITIGKTKKDGLSRQIFIDKKLLDEVFSERITTIHRQELYELFAKCSVDEVFKNFDGVEIEIENSLTHIKTEIRIPFTENFLFKIQHFWIEEKDGLKKISVISKFESFDWSLPWSIRDFVDAFGAIYSSTRNSPFYYDFDLDYDYVQDHDSEENFRLIGILGSAF